MWVAYSSVVLQHERGDVDLLRPDAGEELLQAVQVVDLLLHPRHVEGGEEPRGDLYGGEERRQKLRANASSVLGAAAALISPWSERSDVQSKRPSSSS